jgi:recombinational DNA repair ATPase RecF
MNKSFILVLMSVLCLNLFSGCSGHINAPCEEELQELQTDYSQKISDFDKLSEQKGRLLEDNAVSHYQIERLTDSLAQARAALEICKMGSRLNSRSTSPQVIEEPPSRD